MSSDFQVRTTTDILAVSKALKAQDKKLRAGLNKAIRAEVKPLIQETRQAARRNLPSEGGFAELVARQPQRVRIRTGSKTAGVSLVVTGRRVARAANRGKIRHPVFADSSKSRNEWTWVTQYVEPGWFDETVWPRREDIRRAVRAAVQKFADDLVREANRGG